MRGGDQRQPWPRNWTVHIMNVLEELKMDTSGAMRRITGLADGAASSQHGCTVKQMEDHVLAAIGDNVSKDPVHAGTTGALPANTRTGDVLTAGGVGEFPTIDGVLPVINQFYLVKNEGGGASHINNGIYELTVLGDGGTAWELTRRHDMEGGEGASGAMVPISDGTVNGDTTFKCINNIGSDTINTDALEFWFWGQTTDHANLKNVTADQHHLEDTQARMANILICSWVRGNDSAPNDGSWYKPFKTINHAISIGGDECVIWTDQSAPGGFPPTQENVTIPAGESIHIISMIAPLEEPTIGSTAIGTLTLMDGCKLVMDNLDVNLLVVDAGATLATVHAENGSILNVSNPSKLLIHLYGAVLSSAAYTAIGSNYAGRGWAFDTPGANLRIFGASAGAIAMNFQSHRIEQLGDPVSVLDADNKQSRDAAITTHTGLPDAHHTEDHAPRHKDGGADELDVSELAGALGGAGEIPETDGAAVTWVDPDGRYDPKAHKDSHDPEDGSDPLDAAAPGSIDENANAEGSAHSFARSDHNHQHLAALHENGGGAEISVTGLSGLLADDQPALAHTLGGAKHTADTKANLITKISDVTEIITNNTGEINGFAEKTAPVSADLVLIEDSAASNAKKKVQLGNHPLADDEKGGIIASGSFTGVPRKATVTFTTAYPDLNYTISVIGEDSRNWVIESKAAGSFVINAGSAVAISGNTFWATKPINDP